MPAAVDAPWYSGKLGAAKPLADSFLRAIVSADSPYVYMSVSNIARRRALHLNLIH